MSNDPLSVLQQNLNDVDLTPTLPKKGARTLAVIETCDVQPSKNSGKMGVYYTVKTLEECDAHNKPGKCAAGFAGYDQIMLERSSAKLSDTEMQAMINRDLARFRQACTGAQDGAFAPVEQYKGAQVIAQWDVEEGQNGPRARCRLYPVNKQ